MKGMLMNRDFSFFTPDHFDAARLRFARRSAAHFSGAIAI
jgi:hypothetical protein